EAVRDADLEAALHTDPGEVEEFLEDFYRAQGFLDAAVGTRRYEFEDAAGTARVIVPVQEGPQYRIGRIVVSGNRRVETAILLEGLELAGDVLTPESFDTAFGEVRQRYWDRGFNRVAIGRRIEPDPAAGTADIVFDVEENAQEIVREIEIAGTMAT